MVSEYQAKKLDFETLYTFFYYFDILSHMIGKTGQVQVSSSNASGIWKSGIQMFTAEKQKTK